MGTVKAAAIALIGKMPDDATWERIGYSLMLAAKVAQAEADIAAGRVYSREEVMREMEQWLDSRGALMPHPTSSDLESSRETPSARLAWQAGSPHIVTSGESAP